MPTFPRLRVTDGAIPIGRGAARVAIQRVDPPHSTSIDPKFHTWRMQSHEVVRVDELVITWLKQCIHPATLGFVVRGERELTADEIAWRRRTTTAG